MNHPITAFDVETTMNSPVGSNAASPHWPTNEAVLWGLYNKKIGFWHNKAGLKLFDKGAQAVERPLTVLVAGHHIPFDLQYLWKGDEASRNQTHRNVLIWDTQVAEYLLSAQQHKWASLDELCEKYGLPKKDESVKLAFSAGHGAETIDKDVLKNYLEGDCKNTYTIASRQVEMVVKQGKMPLFMSQMDAVLATTEMSYNGLAIDLDYLTEEGNKIAARIKEIEADTFEEILFKERVDLKSPSQLSKLLFGGTIKSTKRVPDGHYKNGKPRFKTVEDNKVLEGWIRKWQPSVIQPSWTGRSGVVSTSDDVLEACKSVCSARSQAATTIDAVLEHRALTKQLSTYFDGLRELIMPDGKVHHELNHCATVTGRLSGSKPNMQNQPKHSVGDVKRAFVSRWGKDGFIVEADYKQLEMVALAVVSGDKQLMMDIAAGVDTHSALFKEMHGRLPTDDERWSFKRCSFALVYGGGPAAIAAQGNTSKEEAKRFIKVFYDRYPGVKDFHDKMVQWAKDNRVYEGDKDPDTGMPIGRAYYTSPTGRVYMFKEYINKKEHQSWAGIASFSPTELKNYTIQGLATGDIVPLVLGKLLRVLKNDTLLADKCLLINTVHDSIIFDVHKDVLFYAMKKIRSVMEQADEYMVKEFAMDFPLKLKVEMSYGPNWSEQTKEE